jgi:glycosyltransferase involved in cell wall biosynthesis
MPQEFVSVASGEPAARGSQRAIAGRPAAPNPIGRRPCALYVWQSEYPWDVRVEKIARALTDGGFDTHIVARNRQRDPVTEPLPEAVVDRLPPWSWLGQRLDATLQTGVFVNPRWMQHLTRTIRNNSPAIVVVRDLPLAPAAIWAARRFGVPVVLDMAENYPAVIRDNWDVGRHRPWDFIARNPRLARLVDRYAVRQVDHVIVVVEESADRVASLGVPRERITVVSNTPPLEQVSEVAAAPTQSSDKRLEVVYLGILEIPRGLYDAIEAVRMLRSRSIDVRLTIVGSGRDATLFQDRARAAGLTSELVNFTGYVSREEAMRAVATSDVGLLANHRTEQWQTSIPNKLFDYMAAGLAVLTSDTAPCARIVRETAAGEVFRAGDPADLARALERLTDPKIRAAAGEAGRRAVVDRYNWENDSTTLLGVINSLARPVGRGAAAAAPSVNRV